MGLILLVLCFLQFGSLSLGICPIFYQVSRVLATELQTWKRSPRKAWPLMEKNWGDIPTHMGKTFNSYTYSCRAYIMINHISQLYKLYNWYIHVGYTYIILFYHGLYHLTWGSLPGHHGSQQTRQRKVAGSSAKESRCELITVGILPYPLVI